MTNKTSSIDIPPHELVKDFFAMPLPGGVLNVLDAGCCTGRNARYVASLGHRVTGLSIDPEEINVAKNQGDSTNLSYVTGDVLHMPFRGQFDAVMFNEVLQDIDVDERLLAVKAIQRQTVIGGYNVVSAYAGEREKAVDRFELHDTYKVFGWRIVSWYTDEQRLLTGTDELVSKASIIALREC